MTRLRLLELTLAMTSSRAASSRFYPHTTKLRGDVWKTTVLAFAHMGMPRSRGSPENGPIHCELSPDIPLHVFAVRLAGAVRGIMSVQMWVEPCLGECRKNPRGWTIKGGAFRLPASLSISRRPNQLYTRPHLRIDVPDKHDHSAGGPRPSPESITLVLWSRSKPVCDSSSLC